MSVTIHTINGPKTLIFQKSTDYAAIALGRYFVIHDCDERRVAPIGNGQTVQDAIDSLIGVGE